MKKEALEVLYNRRAIRQFKSEQIKDEELKSFIDIISQKVYKYNNQRRRLWMK